MTPKPDTLPEPTVVTPSLSDRLEAIRQQIMARAPGTAEAPPDPLMSQTVRDIDSERQSVSWKLPRVDQMLVEIEETQMSLVDIRDKTRIIEDTLRSLGVPVTVVEVNPGPW